MNKDAIEPAAKPVAWFYRPKNTAKPWIVYIGETMPMGWGGVYESRPLYETVPPGNRAPIGWVDSEVEVTDHGPFGAARHVRVLLNRDVNIGDPVYAGGPLA